MGQLKQALERSNDFVCVCVSVCVRASVFGLSLIVVV